MLFATRLFASEARFTDELWVGIEPAYQRALARGTPAGEPRGLRNALTTLAAKAPSAEWRVTLENLAATMPQSPGGPVTYPRFAEGFAAILPHFWICEQPRLSKLDRPLLERSLSRNCLAVDPHDERSGRAHGPRGARAPETDLRRRRA